MNLQVNFLIKYNAAKNHIIIKMHVKKHKGTAFENIYDLYRFNKDFVQILLKYCLAIEVSFK